MYLLLITHITLQTAKLQILRLILLFLDFIKMKRLNVFHVILFSSLNFLFILIFKEVKNIFIIITNNQQQTPAILLRCTIAILNIF